MLLPISPRNGHLPAMGSVLGCPPPWGADGSCAVLNPGLGVAGRAGGGGTEGCQGRALHQLSALPSLPCPGSISAGSARCHGLLPWKAGRGLQGTQGRAGAG